MVNHVLKLHQAPQVDSFIIHIHWRPKRSSRFLDKWICHSMNKGAKHLAIQLGQDRGQDRLEVHEFSNLYWLLSTHSYADKSAFGSLKSLKFIWVHIDDEMVHCFLASCKNLESLAIWKSGSTKNLRFVDPLPKLKSIEIFLCDNIQSLEISVASLVSFAFDGWLDIPLGKLPNLSDVKLGGRLCKSFFFETDKHLSYSSQLERLCLIFPFEMQGPHYYIPNLPQYCSMKQLELSVELSEVGRSLLFFTIFVKACPFLEEFKILVSYMNDTARRSGKWFPVVSAAEAPLFRSEYLKLITLSGYIGSANQEELLMHLFKSTSSSLETVVINTTGLHYQYDRFYDIVGIKARIQSHGKSTRSEAKEFAENLRTKIPSGAQLVIL